MCKLAVQEQVDGLLLLHEIAAQRVNDEALKQQEEGFT